MPNRILREGILTSPRIVKLGWAEEVFYRRLMSVVDDFGRYYADYGLLRAGCYPRQLNKVSDSDIGKWLQVIADAALVRVYPAQDGERYLQLLDFRQQARAAKSKFPEPRSGCIADAAQPPLTGVAVAPVFGDEGGDEEPPHPPAGGADGVEQPNPHAGFDEFWAEWPRHPRKVGKDQCRAKWAAKGCAPAAVAIVAAVRTLKGSEQWAKSNGEFIPAPLVWLNQRRWESVVGEDAEAWHETVAGIRKKGVELGVGDWTEAEWHAGRAPDYLTYRARVFSAAKHSPRAAA